MTAEHFDKTLQAYQKRRPFRSILVRFNSGEGVSISPTGKSTLFDHESVSEVVGETKRKKA